MNILILQTWNGTWGSPVLTWTQLMLMLLIPKPLFGKQILERWPPGSLPQGKRAWTQSNWLFIASSQKQYTSSQLTFQWPKLLIYMVLSNFKGLEKFSPPICSLGKEYQKYCHETYIHTHSFIPLWPHCFLGYPASLQSTVFFLKFIL